MILRILQHRGKVTEGVLTCLVATVIMSLVFTKQFNYSLHSKIYDDALITLSNPTNLRGVKKPLVLYSVPSCNCFRKGVPLQNVSSRHISTCSDYSTQRGINQRVFSYCGYQKKQKYGKDDADYLKYLADLPERAKEIQYHFPGWVMRIYHNVSTQDHLGTQMLCNLFCFYPHVDLCDVTKLPALGNLKAKKLNGMFWRFSVMGDPTVSIFNSRDTDSAVLPREAAAVQEWLNSDRTFHVMRDHPRHRHEMLGGLWGCKNDRVRSVMESIRDNIFEGGLNHDYGHDQKILAQKLWPFAKNDVMQHDSFNCQKRYSPLRPVPFPTKRENNLYVGWGKTKINQRRVIGRSKCPEICRPLGHKDWKQC